MTPLDQLLQTLNKRPIFETVELKKDLESHIPYLTKDPKTFQKLLHEIDQSQTVEQLKDLLMDADYDNPDSDLINIFNNIDYYLAGPYKDQDIWDLYETLALWCNEPITVDWAPVKTHKDYIENLYQVSKKSKDINNRPLLTIEIGKPNPERHVF